ncbi:MAG: tRNA pseudouridine(38-40) synthase TruA [Flavobacteriaceae bacterium]|nr:tRNA pseudouridine(38-40) synthase TruA [Bacteroidia bacterium]NNF73547.1 tRNA pseudouridine(38-40) synthase TruA [Flavobacteriaceae bacterium]NNK73720.1 tRNA pseudouridine(38-40) synthase TruA [Flavobacteriaceae bacterium]
MRYFIELSYKGTAYHGWQNQPNAITVQEVIEKAVGMLLDDQIGIVGAGRTDTGVHAVHMVAHFDYEGEFDRQQLIYKMNSFLPKDIVIHDIYDVHPEAHARFNAVSREYHYRITRKKDAFKIDLCYYFKPELNVGAMNEAAEMLLHHKNFKCFARSNTDVKTYNCDIEYARWEQIGDELRFVIKADRFLRNMVRAIVGTLLEIGLGKMSLAELDDIIQSKDRSRAGASVPAHGLYLNRIEYPETIRQQ